MNKFTAPVVVALALAACKPSAPAPSAQGSATPAAATSSPAAPSAPAPTTVPSLARGDTAPPFSLQGSDGKVHALSDDAGKNVVVVAWFPKAFTGG